jgi:Major capsid protein Gp23
MENLLHINKTAAEALVEKWTPVLDYSSDKVAAISNDNTRLNTAILLENQEKWCLNEANIASGSGSVFGANTGYGNAGAVPNSDTYATGDARLPKVLIPMIRRTFPELITNEIVGVQPMTGPVGLAFAMRYKYDATPLGNAGGIGDGSLGNTVTGGNTAVSNGSELGYNYLNTAFTGTSSAQLSGLPGVWDNLAEDSGIAALLSQFELSSNIPQMTVSFEKTAVEAGTRRLAAKWSVELEQDLKNMNGIDIDAELTNAMSYEIQAEIDREMIARMIQTCLNAGAGVGYSTWSAISADGRWSGERARDFYNRIVVEANRVAIRNRRGAANFIIGTPRICAILETLPNFTWQPVTGSVNTTPVGIAKVGAVGGRFQVYRDTRTEAELNAGYIQGGQQNPASPYHKVGGGSARTTPVDYALLGYKGPEYYDTGIVYCPYIPVMVQRTIGPNDFSPRVGLLTRYGVVDHIFGANLYYHLVICTGLGQSFTPGSAAIYL